LKIIHVVKSWTLYLSNFTISFGIIKKMFLNPTAQIHQNICITSRKQKREENPFSLKIGGPYRADSCKKTEAKKSCATVSLRTNMLKKIEKCYLCDMNMCQKFRCRVKKNNTFPDNFPFATLEYLFAIV
jgi:hypothetical protein